MNNYARTHQRHTRNARRIRYATSLYYEVGNFLKLRWKSPNSVPDFFSSYVGIGRFSQVTLEITVIAMRGHSTTLAGNSLGIYELG
jgi:hypothetical protein